VGCGKPCFQTSHGFVALSGYGVVVSFRVCRRRDGDCRLEAWVALDLRREQGPRVKALPQGLIWRWSAQASLAWAAPWRRREGKRVIVIDRDAQANGASVRNFGFITVTGQRQRPDVGLGPAIGGPLGWHPSREGGDFSASPQHGPGRASARVLWRRLRPF